MIVIGGVLGGLEKARVIEDFDSTPLVEEKKVAVLLCEAVLLFERSCASTPPQDPMAAMIQNKTRGEELAKIVIDSGLSYLVNPGSRICSGFDISQCRTSTFIHI